LASLDENSNDENEEEIVNDKNKKLNLKTNIIESYDEKKLRMAKMLLDKFDKENKEENEKSDSEEENSEEIMNKKIIEKYTKEMQNQKINFFSLNKDFIPKEISFIKGHKSTITDLSISSKGDLIISSSKDTRGILFDLNKQKKILFPKFTNKALNCCVFSPDEKSAFFGGKDHYIYQIDLSSFDIIQKIKAHNESVTGIIFDKIKDQFYSVGNDKVLKVWSSDTNPAILLETFYGHTSQINNIKSIPGEINRYITTSLDGYINLWKVDSQSFLQFNTSNMYPIDCISPLTNDIFFTGNYNGSIQAWRTNKKKFVYSLNYSHGFQEKFNINHPFFDLNLKNKGPEVEVGKPVLSLESPAFSDLLISGSIDGEINFYKVDKEGNNINIEIKNKMNIKNKGCLNVIKYCQDKKFIVVGNGTDNKFGRWNKEYDNKLGITLVKLDE
jgi:WD40 repeat protein